MRFLAPYSTHFLIKYCSKFFESIQKFKSLSCRVKTSMKRQNDDLKVISFKSNNELKFFSSIPIMINSTVQKVILPVSDPHTSIQPNNFWFQYIGLNTIVGDKLPSIRVTYIIGSMPICSLSFPVQKKHSHKPFPGSITTRADDPLSSEESP